MPLNYSSSKKKKSSSGSTSSKSSVKNSGLTNLGRMIAENDPQAIWSVQRRTERQDRLDDMQRRFNAYLTQNAWNNRLASLDGPIAGTGEERAFWERKLQTSENNMRGAQSRMGYNDNAVFDPTAKRDYNSAKQSYDLAKSKLDTLDAYKEFEKQRKTSDAKNAYSNMTYDNLRDTIQSGYLPADQRQLAEQALQSKATSAQANEERDRLLALADQREAELDEEYKGMANLLGQHEQDMFYRRQQEINNLRQQARAWGERGYMAEGEELAQTNMQNAAEAGMAVDPRSLANRYDDDQYQFIMGNGQAVNPAVASRNRVLTGKEQAAMTANERLTYAQIYDADRANGTDNATRYLKWLQYSLGERLQQRKRNEINAKMNEQRAGSYSPEEFRNLSEDQQLRAALSDVEWFGRARFSNLASGVGAIDASIQKLNNALSGDTYKPVNWNSAAFTPHTVQETISENQLSRIDSPVGKFAYQTAGSMADSLVVMGAAMLGIPATTAILGGSAATDSMLKAKERGATDSQAISVGLLSGVAEALFEDVSLEKLLTAGTPATIKEVIKNIFLRQGITEASEEVFTTIANTLTDAILMGDKSEIKTNIRQYLEQGYSQSDAEKLAAIEWAKDLGLDALGGLVSGAIFGGFEQGISYGRYNSALSNIEGAGDVNAAMGAYQRGLSQVVDENGQVRDDSANAARRLQETYERTVEGLSEYNADYATKSAMIDNMVESGEMSAAEGQMAKTEIAARMEGDTYNEQTKARLEEAQNQRQVDRMRASLRNIPGFEVAEEIKITPDMARAISVDMANKISEDEYVAKQKKGVEKLANISTATISSTKSIVDNYDVNLSQPSDYFGAFRYYEEMGQQARARGIDNFAEVWKTDERYADKISQQAAMVAFAAGKTTAAPASKIMQVRQRGTGALEYSDEALTQLSKNVKSVDDAIELLSAFAKKTGFTVKLDESLKDGENATFAANVMTIALNPRANIIASLFHEAGHAVQRFDPQRYAQMKADMVSWYAQSQGMTDLDAMVSAYGKKAYKGYSRDAIEIEIVNDAFGALFNRPDAGTDLANWLVANKTEEEQKEFANKFEEFFDRIVRWLKNLVNLDKGISKLQNKTVDMQVEKAQAFRKAFLDALDSAAETARNATEYRVDVDATQYDSVAASKSMIDFSLNVSTLNYAAKYTAEDEESAARLKTLRDTLQSLWKIEQEIKKGEGKTSHSIHDINKYLESNPAVHQQLLDVQKAANDAGITCDFVTPIGEAVEVEGKAVAPGLRGLPIEYVEAAEDSKKYVERTSDEYRHEGYKFTAFKRTIPQMFLDSVPHNVRETIRADLVKAVEDAYAKGTGSEILTDIDKAFPSVRELKSVGGQSTRTNINNKTMKGVQAPLRSAEKTVMALNLNSACPMFTIGNHGCYLDACYLTQMANGATGTNLFRTAWYTGELLQLNEDAIQTMRDLGGLRINGVGDTIMDNKSQLVDVLKHAAMRNLAVKIITKQAATFDVLSEAKKAGVDLSQVTVQPSMDNLWIPASLDDAYGAGVRGKTQLADTVKKGNFDAAMVAYDEFFGRATKEAPALDEEGNTVLDDDGNPVMTVYRKYGFSPEQVQKMMERAQKEYPEVTVTPRYVVCTPEEIAEIALNRNKFVVNGGAIIQTLMHGKVPEGCISDYGTTIVNFGGLRHVIERRNGQWDFYGATVSYLTEDVVVNGVQQYTKKGKKKTRKVKRNGEFVTVVKRASGKNSPYQAVMDYVNGTVDGHPRFTEQEKNHIWNTLRATMCCQASMSKDACAGCSSLCASGATLASVKARQSDTLQTVEEGDVLPDWVEKMEEVTDWAERRANATVVDFSRTVEDVNDEYMNAVASGDQDAQQKLVDEAAKNAGYTIKAYHGTTEDFTKFSRSGQGKNHDGYLEFGAGFYFTPSETEAKRWAERGRSGQSGKASPKVMSVYLSAERIINADDPIPNAVSTLKTLGLSQADANFISNRTYRFINYLLETAGYDNTEVQETLKALGYDAVASLYKGGTEGQYVVFDPEQIKSADPITYDDDGNVIPLTERFNPDEQDIRYSLSVEDFEEYKDQIGDARGININDSTQAFTEEILNGEKTIETRTSPTLRNLVGQRVGIVRTGTRGGARLVGMANIAEEVTYDSKESFDADYDKHRVGEDSEYYWNGKTKYGYVLTDVQPITDSTGTRVELPVDASGNAISTRTLAPTVDYSRGTGASLTDTERRTLEKRVREAERNAAKEKQRAEHFKSEMRLTPKFAPNAEQTMELATELSDMFDGTGVDTEALAQKLTKVFQNMNRATEYKQDRYAYTAMDLAQEIAEDIVSASVPQEMTTTLEGKMMRNEAVAMGTNAIMERLLQVRLAKSTKADKWNAKLQEARQALGREQTKVNRAAQRIANLETEFANYRQDMADRIAFLRASAAEQHSKDMAKLKQTRASRDQKIALRKVSKVVKDLRSYLEKPDPKTGKYVQDNVKGPVAQFLFFVDFLSSSFANNHVLTQSDYRELDRLEGIKKIAQQSRLMELGDSEAMDSNSPYLDLPSTTMYAIEGLRAYVKAKLGEFKDAQDLGLADEGMMHLKVSDAEALETVYDLAKSIQWAVKKMNTLFAKGKYASVEQMSRDTVKHLEGVKKSQKINPKLYNSLGWSMATPYYAFHRFGEAGDTIFANLGSGLADFARNINTILDFVDGKDRKGKNGAFTRDEQREWSNQIVEVDANDSAKGDIKLKMTVAQLMSLYCLSRREAAQNHLWQGGIALRETKTKTETVSQEKAVHINPTAIDTAFSRLPAEQAKRVKEVAQKLQEFMSTVGSEWGNKVTMERWGVRGFTEKFYFPMATSDAARSSLTTNDSQSMSLYALANMGFTKALQKYANNALVLDDIFNVFSDHMANMAKYSSMVLPMLDAMKWYNWSETNRVIKPGGQKELDVTSLKTAVKEAFGGAATQYFRQFMSDLNAADKEGGAGYDIGSRLMSHYKAAAVGANLRVALLQPTAFFRAAMVLSPSDLAKGAAMRGGQEEMMKYSGIAQWKDLGFYDTDIGRSVRRQIQGEKTKWGDFKNKAVDISMKAAEYGDKITWAALWNACKIEQRRENPNASYEDLMKLTERRFNEVIFSTQVFDSTLSRSEVMRSKDGLKKIMTAFLSEPTLSFNMVLDKFFQYSMDVQKLGKGAAWKKHGGQITRALAVYSVTNVVAALAESFADAWRDDDDDPFWKKMMDKMFGDWSEVDDPLKAVKQYYTANLMNDMSVLGKIPILKEIVSLAQGFDIGGRMDVQALQSIKNVVGIWNEKINLMTGKLDKATKETWYGNMTTYGAIYKTLQAASQISGIPVYNGLRDVIGIYNSTLGKLTGKLLTYESKYGAVDKSLDGTQDTIKKAIADAVEKGTSEKDVFSHIKSTIKDRYTGAEGEPMTRDRAKQLLVDTVGMKNAAADVTLDQWTMSIDTGISYDKMKESYMEDDITEKQAIDYRMKYGHVSQKDAEETVADWKAEKETGYAYADVGTDYAGGYISRSEAIDLYVKYGASNEEAADKVDLLDFKNTHPGTDDYTVAKMKKYKEFGEKAKVSVDVFYDVLSYKGDDNKKDKVMAFINQQSISRDQKNALYRACGYAESTIDDAPWN